MSARRRWQVFWKVILPAVAARHCQRFPDRLHRIDGSDFGNPLVLAGAAFPMLAPQAYLEITGVFNLPRGATLAVVLLIPSLIAFFVQRYYLVRRQYVTVTGKPAASTTSKA